MMILHMFSASHHDKVFRTVIVSDSVKVVDNLIWQKVAF